MKRLIPKWFFLLVCLGLAGCNHDGSVITSVQDAATARIGVMVGTTSELIMAQQFPKADAKRFDDIMDAIGALKTGQLDAVLTGYPAALQVSKKNPDLALIEERLSHEDTSIAVRKGNGALLQQVDEIISGFKADGTLAAMGVRWLKKDLTPYEEVAIPLPKEGVPIKIGVSATREPFSFVDATGQITGHDGELARRIAAKMHRPIQFLDMKFMALIPALQAGKIDLIVTGMSATPERRKKVDFTQRYYELAQVLLVRSAAAAVASVPKPEGLRSLTDLKKGRIGVLTGSAHEVYAVKNYPEAEILQYRAVSDLALAVSSRKVDAALSDEAPFKDLQLQDASFSLLGEPLFTFDVGVGFRKENTALRDQFNHFLADIKGNDVYREMVHRWLETPDPQMPPLKDEPSLPPLKVGITDGGLPFAGMKENLHVGLDVELTQRFAQSIGRRVEYENMDFGSLVAAVASGKVDLIASAIYITPERKERINFSDPYFQMATIAFTLKSRLAESAASVTVPAKPSFWQRTVDSFVSNIIREHRYLLLLDGLKTTMLISILASIFGTMLGAGICYMRLSKRLLLRLPARVFIDILRGMPVLVLLMLIFYVVFASVDISPVLVAVVAFGLNFAAYAAEIFRSGIEGIDKGQTEAGISLGFTRTSTFIYIVMPQMIQRVLPVYKGEFISLVKMTSIVGYIAVQDLTKASDIIRSRTFDAFFPLVMVAVLYFAVSWVLIQLLDFIERRTDPKRRREESHR